MVDLGYSRLRPIVLNRTFPPNEVFLVSLLKREMSLKRKPRRQADKIR